MPKRKRSTRIPTPAWQPSPPRLGGLGWAWGAKGLLVGAIVGLVILAVAVIFFAFLRDYLEERSRPGSAAVTVGQTTFDLDYFARRLRLFVLENGLGSLVVQQPEVAVQLVAGELVEEETLRTFAPELEVSLTAAELDEGLAERLGLEKSDPNFPTAYQQELLRSGFSDQEYRQLVEADLLAEKVRERLGQNIAAEGEQVHYRQIRVSSQQEGEDIIGRLIKGEDFAELAKQLSLDTATAANGGDVGWLARGQGDQELEDTLFALQPGQISNVFSRGGSLFFVFQVVERQVRPLDSDQREQVLDQNYREWLQEKGLNLEVINYVLNDDGKLRWALNRVYGS